MSNEYTTVKAPGFEMTKPATMENNLEQLSLAVDIRKRTAKDLKTRYQNFDVIQIQGILNYYLRLAKEDKGISCIKSIGGYKDTCQSYFVKAGMPEFIQTYVKQTQYAALKTEEQLLLNTR